MRKLLLTILVSSSITTSFAQDSTNQTKVYHNEFGIDATGFLKQFLNFSDQQYPSYYSPTYYLTYRRHFNSGNVRFAFGGAFSNYDIPASLPDDLNKYHYNSYSLSTRIGCEFVNDLGKNWQVFYGLDFRSNVSYIKNDVPYWNGGYANGSETKSQIYGAAPLLGFRFKLSNRISILTETSLSINWQKEYSRRYYIPVTSQYPQIPDQVNPKTKKVLSSFSQPLSIFLTFDI